MLVNCLLVEGNSKKSIKGDLLMARRKSKKKQKEEALKALTGLVVLGSFFGGMQLTGSFETSLFISALALGGLIAILIFRGMAKREKLRKSGISDIDKMDGFKFESYLGELFRNLGYEAKVTQGSGDFGADLILKKADQKIVVQAKRYSKNVGIKAVQEAQASIAHYKANAAWVVTNSDFTEAAYTLAKSNQVLLINREKLIELILEMKESKKVKVKNAS